MPCHPIRRLVAVLLALTAISRTCLSKDDVPKPPPEEKGSGASGGAEALPGFTLIPAGSVHPGTTPADIKARAANPEAQKVLMYEQWGRVKEVLLEAFHLGRFEVTNAQWKHYLDSRFRREITTGPGDTLASIARQNVLFRSEPEEGEWVALFVMNQAAIEQALKEAKLWTDTMDEDHEQLKKVVLPSGLRLTIYRHRIPRHWIGWSTMAHMNIGREYFDPAKPAPEAFRVPEGEAFAKLRLRDFAACPVRDISLHEALDFVEWAGGGLPSEYEYERAGRADRENTEQFPFAGTWDHRKNLRPFAWVGNPACEPGPLAVDDESVAAGDGIFGQRHLLGNVWEMTRTPFNAHPDVSPALPPLLQAFNYFFVVKGGAWGDSRMVLQLSTRTGSVGSADFHLQFNHRTDTVGFRLKRSVRPGVDLLWHSMMRLVYNPGRGLWDDEVAPPNFSFARAVGIDSARYETGGAPYIHVRDRALGIGILPVWMTELAKPEVESGKDRLRLLGILRSDLPLRAGVKLSKEEEEKLLAMRKAWDDWKKNPPKPQKGKPKPVPPPEPPPPSPHEDAGSKLGGGLWVEGAVPAGEFYLGVNHGALILLNKAKIPVAILAPRAKDVLSLGGKPKPSAASVDAAGDKVTLELSVEEQGDGKPQTAPGQKDAEWWALCETPTIDGWPGRKPQATAWHLKISLEFEKGLLKDKNWNQ